MNAIAEDVDSLQPANNSEEVTPNGGQFPRMLAALRGWIAGKDHSAPPSLRALFLNNGGELSEGERIALTDAQKKEIRPIQKEAARAHSAFVRANKRSLLNAFHSLDKAGGLLRARVVRDEKGVKSVSIGGRRAPKPKAK